jgi:hypothetical protein
VDRACQKARPSAAMMIMCVLVDKLLCQDSWGWSSVFGGYATSCPDLNGASPQNLDGHGTCPAPKGPRVRRQGPYGQVEGFCLFYGYGGKPSIAHS